MITDSYEYMREDSDVYDMERLMRLASRIQAIMSDAMNTRPEDYEKGDLFL